MVEFIVFILLRNVCVALSTDIYQPTSFLAAKLGDNVTIECHVDSSIPYMVWYKINTGKKIQPVAKADMFYKYVSFFDAFGDGRFSVLFNSGTSLLLAYTKPEDVGIYYCGAVKLNYMEFGAGTLLVLEGVELNSAVIQQPVFESVQLGDSVTLNCTIHTETCAGEHRVYWFRHGSGQSHPGIIYTNGDRSGQCKKSPEAGSPTQSCVYNLPKRNLSLSDAGTYYCAVASCGEILFGNGTTLDIQVSEQENLLNLNPTVLALVLSNIVLCVVTLLLIRVLCKTRSRDETGTICEPRNNQNLDIDAVNYAAVSFNPKKNISRKVKTSRDNAVYSEVMYLQQD